METTRVEGHKAFDAFVEMFKAKYPKATACLKKDREVLLTFYDFPPVADPADSQAVQYAPGS